jgi:pyroglutamyl-peptidase
MNIEVVDLKIVVTGFEAFLKNTENPSLEVIRLLPKSISGNQIYTLELPVAYDKCFEPLKKIIDEISPDIVICLGLAQGRTSITPERVAINISDVSVPDNLGVLKTDDPIIENGEAAYFSTLPIKEMVEAMKLKGIPATISNSAGTYVCNNVMYHLLAYNKTNNLNMKAGFIHVPLMDEQSNDGNHFSMPLASILEGIIASIKICL